MKGSLLAFRRGRGPFTKGQETPSYRRVADLVSLMKGKLPIRIKDSLLTVRRNSIPTYNGAAG